MKRAQQTSFVGEGAERPAVEFQIDELLLHGFAPGDRQAVGDSLRAELTRLIAEGGVPAWAAAGGVIPALDAGSFTVAQGARPEAVGAQVARAVYGGGRR